MNKFDQFVKHELRVKKYARYTDDFVIIAHDRAYLEMLLPQIRAFLWGALALSLHPNKVTIQKCRQGVDFLGYVLLPHHTLVRKKTQRRIFHKLKKRTGEYRRGLIEEKTLFGSLRSYLGVLSHADAHEVTERLKNQFWFWLHE